MRNPPPSGLKTAALLCKHVSSSTSDLPTLRVKVLLSALTLFTTNFRGGWNYEKESCKEYLPDPSSQNTDCSRCDLDSVRALFPMPVPTLPDRKYMTEIPLSTPTRPKTPQKE